MQLFQMKDYVLSIREEAWALLPFKAILKKDKSRDKSTALKEMLFIYYFCDIKSDYIILSNPIEKEREIIKDIGLPETWKPDAITKVAMNFYEERSLTVIGKLYKNTLKSVNDISDYLYHTDILLAERDNSGKPVNDISKITAAVTKVKGLMQDLKAAEKEVIKEQQELEGRTKGSKTLNLFEDGLNID